MNVTAEWISKHELCQRYCANFAGLETDNKQHGFFKD